MGSPRSLMVKTSVGQIISKDQNIILLRQDATIEAALKVLAKHHILSAPVVVPNDGPGSVDACAPNRCPEDIVGFVDIRDILSSYLAEADLASMRGMRLLKRMQVLEESGQKFASKTLEQLSVLGHDGSFFLENGSGRLSLLELVHDGFLYPKGAKAMHGGTKARTVGHRVALYSKEGCITNIVSQSDVVRFLFEHVDELGPLADKTVSELGWAPRPVIHVTPESPAIEVMSMMDERNISAVAVVDKDKKLLGNFSISDLRAIVAEHFGSMALPVGEFLALEHGIEFWGVKADPPGAPEPPPEPHPYLKERDLRRTSSAGCKVGQQLITAEAGDTFRDVLQLLVESRMHRLYVVTPELEPVGIITLTDVLRQVVEAANQTPDC
ncbi:hypothetical protein WJX72_006411 [[Myrmecia] bisecta]|uniref:CBS domain-containing protein n=1 Tax=[Myrmecia] bisecta TaxID=41462 RepID=A0AAW1R878_9CHLO